MHSNTGEMADQCNKTRWNFCLWRNAGPLAVLLGYRSWKHLVSGNCKVFCHTSELCCCFVFPPRLWKWCQIAGREFIQGPSDVRRSTRTDEKIATLKLSGSHTVKPNQSAALRYGWHLGTNLRKTHFMLSVWFTARMCHYDWNVSVCFHMFLAAGHHMFAEQNTACSACLSGKFNKSHPLAPSLEWMGNIRYFNRGVRGHAVNAWATPDADRAQTCQGGKKTQTETKAQEEDSQ